MPRKETDNFGYSYGVTLSEEVCNSILSRTIFNELLSRSFPIARFAANRREGEVSGEGEERVAGVTVPAETVARRVAVAPSCVANTLCTHKHTLDPAHVEGLAKRGFGDTEGERELHHCHNLIGRQTLSLSPAAAASRFATGDRADTVLT